MILKINSENRYFQIVMFIKRIIRYLKWWIRYLKWWIRWTIEDAGNVLIVLLLTSFTLSLMLSFMIRASILPTEWDIYWEFLYDLILLPIKIHLPICFYSVWIAYKDSKEPNFFKWSMSLDPDMQNITSIFFALFCFFNSSYILLIIDIIYYSIF